MHLILGNFQDNSELLPKLRKQMWYWNPNPEITNLFFVLLINIYFHAKYMHNSMKLNTYYLVVAMTHMLFHGIDFVYFYV